ncbi:DUF1189 family protein [candidate division KSB1 bacterium]|nr:DUF1189 family protein [candidate division KSB1 bacterium]
MTRLLQQKRFSIIPIVATTVILSVYIIIPLLQRLDHYVDLYEPVLNDTTPTIILQDGKIEFEGNIPQHIELASGVEVFFAEIVNDSLFQLAPVNSVFISSQEIWHKRSDGIKKYDLQQMQIDDEPLVLQPLQLREKLHRLRNTVFVILIVTLMVGLFLILVVLAYFGAGVGIMIDAFQNGPYSFAELLNWSSIFLLLCALLWIVFTSGTVQYVGYAIIAHVTIMIVFVHVRLFARREGI